MELLIGENEIKAAKGLKYKFEKFRSDDDVEDDPGDEFVEWARQQIDSGSVVILGFYDNEGDKDEYDHIMPIVGYKKDKKDNTLGLYYNDLYDVSKARYVSAETDVLDREECEAEEDEEQKYCIPKETVCAIAIKGHVDTAKVL